MILVDRNGVISSDATAGEIEHLNCLAAAVLSAHIYAAGECVVCSGVTFPCMAAELAQHAVTLRQAAG